MFWLAALYSRLYGVVKARTGRNLRGLGFLLRRVQNDRELVVQGRAVWMSANVAQAYGRLVAGQWNEPETHTLLNRVFDRLGEPATFVDVGANIGEMVVDIAGHVNATAVYAFEPIRSCADAIRRSVELNGFRNVQVIESLCGDGEGVLPYVATRDLGNSSAHVVRDETNVELMAVTTLDKSVEVFGKELVILVDVEGYELNVMRGSMHLIHQFRPLIVFEFNHISKQHFSLSDVRNLLGAAYEIWRLRQDATLDKHVNEAWNCVAIPHGSTFHHLVDNIDESKRNDT